MTRVHLFLLLLILGISVVLVRTQYESRKLTTDIDRARAEARRLEIERERLDLEARTQATPLRVEKLAREQLGMRTISPAITVYVADPAKTTAISERQP
ncbi:MAG: cell division protein FtsL [Alphaproteobacteria bacterium]|nr:cell division protein FtsL [Alphaproteobacteria bacterium]MDI9329907.1 cell division protein FtsL [Alphaproteobacteria bacterium]